VSNFRTSWTINHPQELCVLTEVSSHEFTIVHWYEERCRNHRSPNSRLHNGTWVAIFSWPWQQRFSNGLQLEPSSTQLSSCTADRIAMHLGWGLPPWLVRDFYCSLDGIWSDSRENCLCLIHYSPNILPTSAPSHIPQSPPIYMKSVVFLISWVLETAPNFPCLLSCLFWALCNSWASWNPLDNTCCVQARRALLSVDELGSQRKKSPQCGPWSSW